LSDGARARVTSISGRRGKGGSKERRRTEDGGGGGGGQCGCVECRRPLIRLTCDRSGLSSPSPLLLLLLLLLRHYSTAPSVARALTDSFDFASKKVVVHKNGTKSLLVA